MSIRSEFPRRVIELQNEWIVLRDGTRIAARIWMPDDADKNPVPAILEYLPYRKDESTAPRDALTHPYVAGYGYACLRVDIRGSGDSDGLMLDEYLLQEQDDALEIIEWIASQKWCSGNVGMIGISWGGFNALQVAARRPPQLKAIVTVCSTDDRYADDVHFIGGCLLACESLPWSSTMLVYGARPPYPHIVGERWRQMWMERLEKTDPFINNWMRHQRRDEFWKHGSICEDYSQVECAVYAVGGWADPYSNAIMRMLSGLQCPKKGLIGPWGHEYPYADKPGPAIGFLQEALRWWDHWLKGKQTGIMDEPMLRIWMQGSKTGHWIAESLCDRTLLVETLYLGQNTLSNDAAHVSSATVSICNDQTAGSSFGAWCPHGEPWELTQDQAQEDRAWTTFDSQPLSECLEILGTAELHAIITSNKPQANLVARVCEVKEDGTSFLITYAFLNLSRRESHEQPTPVPVGQPFSVNLRFRATAYRLCAGSRLRLALSSACWPYAWPSPEIVSLTVHTGSSVRLELPLRTPSELDAALNKFEKPETSEPLKVTILRESADTRVVSFEEKWCVITDSSDQGLKRFEKLGVVYDAGGRNVYRIKADDPISAHVRCERFRKMERDGWSATIVTKSEMRSDRLHFYVSNEVIAHEGDDCVFHREWEEKFARDFI